MAFKIEGKEMLTIEKYTPSLFSQSVVGQFTTSGKAWQACAQQTENSRFHTNSAVSRQVYIHALQVLHLLRWRCADFVIHHERDVREEQHPHISGANKQ